MKESARIFADSPEEPSENARKPAVMLSVSEGVYASLNSLAAIRETLRKGMAELEFAQQWLSEMEAEGEDHDRRCEASIGLEHGMRKLHDADLLLENEMLYLRRVGNKSKLGDMRVDNLLARVVSVEAALRALK